MTLFKNSFTNKFDRDCAFEYIDSDKSILQRENCPLLLVLIRPNNKAGNRVRTVGQYRAGGG